jgi:7-cyano-7-deazaguanine reductase
LCPVTGQPDFGDITIKYIPDELCIESKSLKIFLFSFRNHNTFHEEAVNTILDEVVKQSSPKWAEITGVFMPRGGIALTIKADYKKKADD